MRDITNSRVDFDKLIDRNGLALVSVNSLPSKYDKPQKLHIVTSSGNESTSSILCQP